jgi:Ca-activated chloride channel homolog
MMRPKRMFSRGLVWVLSAVGLLAASSPALAWDPFTRPNSNVEDGNQAVAEGDFAGALEAYDRASRELPTEPGVQLDRGIALLHQGDHEQARQALLRATEPNVDPTIRADAYYDLGLSFYRSGDALATELDHQRAQEQFREAVDSYRRSLRARPGDRNTAWNLELALRRLREEEQAQQEQEEQQQAQNDQNQEGENQDQQQQGSEGEDQNSGEDGQNEQSNEDQESQNDQEQSSDSQEGQDQSPEQTDQEGEGREQQSNADDSQQQDPAQGQNQQQGSPGGEERDPSGAGGQEIPDDVARVLDALQASEENLERYRARARALRENRAPTKDW